MEGIIKTIKSEIKEEKGGFLSMLLGTLRASLLGNILAGKEIVRAGSGNKKKELQELVMENNGIFNAVLSFTKF